MFDRVRARLARFKERAQVAAAAMVAAGGLAAAATGGAAIDDHESFNAAPVAATVPATVPQLVIATPPPDIEEYDRDTWKHWQTRSCRTTRNQVLVDEHVNMVIEFRPHRSDKQCVVASGQWVDPYSGGHFTDPSDLDIDHLVPLKNAHLSGGWQWDEGRKKVYANFLDDPQHLIAVEAALNREKGAQGPEAWQPPNEAYHCQYAIDWIIVKATWELTATPDEWEALKEMLDDCDPVPAIVDNE